VVGLESDVKVSILLNQMYILKMILIQPQEITEYPWTN
jgi:hypothetical protein